MLENDEDFMSADIYIDPPADSDNSDQDSGAEDGGGTVDNLPRNVLQAEAFMVVHRVDGDQEIGHEEGASREADSSATAVSDTAHKRCSKRQRSVQHTTEASTSQPTNSIQAVRPKKKSKIHPETQDTFDNNIAEDIEDATACPVAAPPVQRKWSRKDVTSVQPEWNGTKPDFLQKDMTPCYIFDCFWDDEIIEHTVNMSKLYAAQKGKANFEVTSADLRGVLAILLISGYAPLPSRRMYWEQADDVSNTAVSSIMSLNRFEEIIRYLHFADNLSLPVGDKLAKVRPLYNMMNKRFLQYFPVEQHLDVDESMIPYYGRHSAKQFIRGKPIRFGYKVWCLNTRLGYLVQCDPYQGKGPYLDPQLGLGGSVVRYLLKKLPKLNYCLYIDNYFTSLKLLDQLRRDNIATVGTVRSNRIEKCPLKDASQMKKVDRGFYDFRTDTTSGTIVVRWQDNSVVTIASNTFGVQPITHARRWSVAKNCEISVEQPCLIAKYNYGMGGTDRMDQNIQQYRIGIRCKKWWWQLFAYQVDVAVQNSWLIYRQTPASDAQPMSLLQFRRSIVQAYVRKYKSRSTIGRPVGRSRALDERVPAEARYDGHNHFIQRIATQRRCANCGMKAKTVCEKCTVAVHDRCFADFHSK